MSKIRGLYETLCFYSDNFQEPQRLPSQRFNQWLVSWTQCCSTVSSQDRINNAQCPAKYVNHCLEQLFPSILSHCISNHQVIYIFFTSLRKSTFVSTMVGGSHCSLTDSSRSSRGSEKDYALSINVYGRGDTRHDDSPAHWEAMLHKRGEVDGDFYHVRKAEDFYYEHSAQRRPIEVAASHGRNEIQHLSKRNKAIAAQVLDAYGKDRSNLPRGNETGQDWIVGALGALEREKLVPRGTRDYWSQNIGQVSSDIGHRIRRDGGSWIPSTTGNLKGQGPADATFGREQVRQPVGRLNLDDFAGLSGSSKSRR